MPFRFNPFTGNLDDTTIPDSLIVDNLTVNSLLQASHIHGNLAGSVYIHVKNADTVPLAKGTPFYVSGTVGASDRVEIKRANNLDPNSAPAIGLVENALEVNGEGNGVIIGEIFNYDTDTPGWDTNDPLYVGENGAITNVEPTSGYRQIVGYVGRVNQSSGTIIVTCNRQDPVAGSNTEIQFNDNGGFGSSTDLTWDDTGKVLGVGGDINLDDGGTYATTLQVITPTANRVISYPDATGTVALVAGSSGQLIYNNAGANAGTPTLTYDGSILTSSGRFINSYNATASSPAKTFTGTWFTGGTTTTTKPHFLIEPAGTTSTAWSTSGTGLGINAASGFAGNLLDLQVNGASLTRVASNGRIEFGFSGGASSPQICGPTTSPFNLYLGGTSSAAQVAISSAADGGIILGSTRYIAWASGTLGGSSTDTVIYRDAAGTLAQRNGTNAQTFRVYGTYTDASNYVRAALSSTSTAVTLAAETAGTGADNIPLNLTAAGTGTVKINSVAEVASSSTVAGLPTSPVIGMITRVTDASSPTLGATVSGGGSAAALVWYNGANWTVLGV